MLKIIIINFNFTRLIHDREIELFDGTRLLGGNRFSEAKKHNGLNDEQMAKKFVSINLYLLYIYC